MEISVEKIEKAIYQFYQDSLSQDQAHQWLTTAQTSPEGWNFAWELLHPSKATEVQFYGASTLHMKISRFWSQLPQDHYEPLKQKLLEWIVNYTSGPKLILHRLCIALSSFIIQTISEFWTNAVEDICSLHTKEISHIAPEALAKVSLEILTFLPEEFNTIIIDQYNKGIIKNSLTQSSHTVFHHLARIFENLQNESEELQLLVVKCLNSWIQFIGCLSDIEPFLPHLFKAVTNDDINEIVLESLANIILHHDAQKYPGLLLKFVSYSMSFETILEKATQDDDLDLCSSIYGVVISLFECHTALLFEEFRKDSNKREMVLKLINMILKCSGSSGQYPTEETSSESSFCIWFTIQDEVMAALPEHRDFFLLYLVPIYKSLVDLLLVKVSYPADETYSLWNSELKNHFRCYRQDIADTFSYCYNILKGSMLNMLSSNIAVLLQTSQDPPWQQLEACLFAFQSVSANVGCQESTFLPPFFQSICNIPMKNPRVTSTLFDSIGAYSEWISYHPEHCETILPLLLQGINNFDVAPSATLCLKELCRECVDSLCDYFETILSAIQVSLQESTIGMNEQVRLVATLGSILSEMPPTNVFSYLNVLVLPYIYKLEKLASEPPNEHMKPGILLSMNVISMLFLTLKVGYSDNVMTNVPFNENTDESPSFQVMLQLMPILTKIGLLWCQDSEILDSICVLLKRSSSSLCSMFKPLLPDTLALVLQIYQKYPHQNLIDLSKQLLVLFGDMEALKSLMHPFFQQLCNVTLVHINQDFRGNTNVIDEFLQMLAQLLKKKKIVFFESSIPIQHLFLLAVGALALPENLTVKSASQFLTAFILASRENSVTAEVVNSNGASLVERIFRMIGGESTRAMIDYLPDLVLALNQKYFDSLCHWSNILNSNENLPVPTITKDQKIMYTRNILKEKKNRRILLRILKEYSLLCRGLIGTEYGRQTCLP